MKEAVMRVSALCLTAALYEQLIEGGSFFKTLRLALGLEAVLTLFDALERCLEAACSLH